MRARLQERAMLHSMHHLQPESRESVASSFAPGFIFESGSAVQIAVNDLFSFLGLPPALTFSV